VLIYAVAKEEGVFIDKRLASARCMSEVRTMKRLFKSDKHYVNEIRQPCNDM
jgi:hypothetical protein